MVTPITGPFTIDQRQSDPPGDSTLTVAWRRSVSSRQRKPYNLPLPYNSIRYRLVSRRGSTLAASYNAHRQVSPTNSNSTGSHCWTLDGVNAHRLARTKADAGNRAFSKFLAAQGETAGGLVSMVQYKQAMEMTENRLIQMTRFLRHMRRLEFGWAAQALLGRHDRDGWQRYSALRESNSLKRGSKDLANNILEMSFGWMPLISDIYAAHKILTGPVPPQRVQAYSQQSYAVTLTASSNLRYIHSGYVGCKIGADIRVDNYNLHLANKLGLVNPLAVMYEVIPWSFVVNYFINVEEYLNQWTADAGVSWTNPYHTYTLRELGTYHETGTGGYFGLATGSVEQTIRYATQFPGVVFKVRPPWSISAFRGMTSAALLTQLLPQTPRDLRARRLVTDSERKRYRRLADHFAYEREKP